jgi:hypothetical protein
MSENQELNKKWEELMASNKYGTVWAGSMGMSRFPNNGTSVADVNEILNQPVEIVRG